MDQYAAGGAEDDAHIPPRDGTAAGQSRSGVVFALRFGNDDGVVQKFFAHQRDLAAGELAGRARFYLAFTRLGDESAYTPRWSTEVLADFYDMSSKGRESIRRFVADNSVRLVVFQGTSPGEIDTIFFRRLGVATVNTEDGSFNNTVVQPIPIRLTKLVLRRILQRNLHETYIANSAGQVDFLLNYVKLPRSRVKLVRYGIDLGHYGPGDRIAACEQLSLDPAVTWIMAAAQSRPEKRVDCLIRAVKQVMDARPGTPIGFFYVGGGEKLQEWQELGRSLLPEHACRFFGRQAEMRPFYQAASLFIHGAARESFGLVLTEAMATALPVVATWAYGPAEIIEEGKTGFLVSQDDWAGFVGAVLRYIDSPELRRAHGEAARDRCLARYGIDRAAAEMADCLRPLLL